MKFATQMAAKGMYVPHLAMAGGFSLEDHIYKTLAMGSPFFKAVCMGRGLMIPAFIGKNIGKWMKEEKLPKDIKEYGDVPERIFVTYETLKAKYGKDFKDLPLGAIGMYTFVDRLKVGLQQFLAGNRKFDINMLERSDVFSLTRECSDVTGIPYVMEDDIQRAESILFD